MDYHIQYFQTLTLNNVQKDPPEIIKLSYREQRSAMEITILWESEWIFRGQAERRVSRHKTEDYIKHVETTILVCKQQQRSI